MAICGFPCAQSVSVGTLRSMRLIAISAVLVAVPALAGCGGGGDPAKPKEPIPYASIDKDAWRHDLVSLGGIRAHPDLHKLYTIATGTWCGDGVDELALGFTLSGARPDLTRVILKYVCPSQVGKVDKALKQDQDATSKVDEACGTPTEQRTTEQQQLVDAVGCN